VDVVNGSLTGRDLKGDSLTGRQVKEGSLGEVPRATLAGRRIYYGKVPGRGTTRGTNGAAVAPITTVVAIPASGSVDGHWRRCDAA